ncbi:MAG TPA: hypothetical protein VFU36_16630, partial [Jatrophihabitans sp.]|nr:hypothetical protein [Jatrophihabitans sp.]
MSAPVTASVAARPGWVRPGSLGFVQLGIQRGMAIAADSEQSVPDAAAGRHRRPEPADTGRTRPATADVPSPARETGRQNSGRPGTDPIRRVAATVGPGVLAATIGAGRELVARRSGGATMPDTPTARGGTRQPLPSVLRRTVDLAPAARTTGIPRPGLAVAGALGAGPAEPQPTPSAGAASAAAIGQPVSAAPAARTVRRQLMPQPTPLRTSAARAEADVLA